MGAQKGAWNRFRRASGGAAIGRLAIIVHICCGCGRFHEGRPAPAQCSCGRMDFDRFDSRAEATRWAGLKMLQRAGKIGELQRQVRYPLLTVHHQTGKPVQWGTYIADFVYLDLSTGERVIEDKKGSAVSPEAVIKLRVMEASGRTVTLT